MYPTQTEFTRYTKTDIDGDVLISTQPDILRRIVMVQALEAMQDRTGAWLHIDPSVAYCHYCGETGHTAQTCEYGEYEEYTPEEIKGLDPHTI